MLSNEDIAALWLTVKLATTVTLLLLILAIPLAWWLANTRSWLSNLVNTLVAMPLVLPPTVIGFYLLMLFSPTSWFGQSLQSLGIGNLAFSFSGLVIASIIYSLPFVVQPIQNAFSAIGKRPLEVAATLGASPIDRFFTIVLPMAKPGIITASVLGFAHTVGEFGVVLMIGGNIPKETQVVSVQIYQHVEALQYDQAHSLSLVLVVFSFVVLFLLSALQRFQLWPSSTKQEA